MKMKRLYVSLILLALAILVVPGQSTAYTIAVNFDAGTTQVTDALTGYGTTGAMMDGMAVTASFLDGTSQTLYWADTDSDSGAVSDPNSFLLGQDGDTFQGLWSLLSYSNSITSLFIDAGTGDSVFDTQYIGDVYGTDGSARGWTFDVQSASDHLDIVATYIDQVALDGFAPVGDLYRYLQIDFINNGGFASTDTLQFIADTDNLLFAGDITPAPVPEPSTILLVGTGLLGIIGFGRKRLNKKA